MAKNILGGDLIACSTDPMTGFFRNGKCDTRAEDQGMHTICVLMTAEFLEFSAACGNDLSTPNPEYGFQGLKPGDYWCLCLSRWIQAHDAGMAPKVRLEATHASVLEFIELAHLQEYAV
ncbi:DUF2237 family protein [Pontiella sulfatireligans]|uniref:DUF2237 domain-containing protein n=1 Tax=Pontiella sulfatireligans TaxID=2750658 RepID=A0A6C2UKX4_9BACT|nr:DUF2237 domain-containing protein [Pontiella sulfatireligans]VGO20895.1 hypothetical protein SCARR_02962 [Pontiella sulfatireligans]